MTNSTADTVDSVKIKKVKNKGPLRIEALIPIVVIVVLSSLYGKFFFDSNLASGIEYAGSVVHGAEINIGKIKSSVFGASINILDIQVTDKEDPKLNMIQVQEVRLKLLWDALLRGKVVIEDSGVTGVAFKSPREKPGKILKSEERGSEALKKLESGVLDQSKEEFQGNILGDLASVIGGGGAKDQLDAIRGELVVEKTLDEMSADLDAKEVQWKKSIDGLTQKEDINAIRAKIKNLKIDKKKPWKIVKQVKPLVKEVKNKTSEFKTVSREVKTMYTKYGDTLKNIDKLAEQDMKALQSRLKIPNIDVADFSMGLFGRMFQEKVASIRKYTALAEEYLPKSVTDKAKNSVKSIGKTSAPGDVKAEVEKPSKLIPPRRGKGENVRYPITTGYPLFWLKKAEISSKAGASEFSGDISGEMTNFTTDPTIVKKPANIKLAGDFPKQGIKGFKTDIYLRHVNDQYIKEIKADVSTFPVDGMDLSKSENLEFGFNRASGKTKLNAVIKGNQAQVSLNNWFSQIDYNVSTKNAQMKDILQKVVAGIPVVTVNANATGNWEKLNWKVGSNLGKELSRGVKREVKGKIDEQKNKYKKQIEDKIGPKKKKLMAKYNKIKSKMDKLIGSKKKGVEDSGKQALNDIKSKEKSGTKSKVKSGGKKLLKKFKKKFKF
ncbi:MAG: TIGR03545 family protein [Bacteriovoracaceae bacterium]|nr:TIGR03545 family protein [Bacteriovoracaceae bacterium]